MKYSFEDKYFNAIPLLITSFGLLIGYILNVLIQVDGMLVLNSSIALGLVIHALIIMKRDKPLYIWYYWFTSKPVWTLIGRDRIRLAKWEMFIALFLFCLSLIIKKISSKLCFGV